jgi:hypothetical protein
MERRASGHRDLDGGLSNASECYALNSREAIRIPRADIRRPLSYVYDAHQDLPLSPFAHSSDQTTFHPRLKLLGCPEAARDKRH